MRFHRHAILAALLGALGLGHPASLHAAPAPAPDAMTQIQQLNTEAAAAFEAYSYGKGRAKLQEALGVAARAGLAKDKRLAATHILLGVAAIAGQSDLYRGLHAFVAGLRLDPKAQVPKRLSNPELEQALASARRTAAVVKAPPTIDITEPAAAAAAAAAATRIKASGLDHSAIDEAKRGYPIPVKAAVGTDVQAHRVQLFYRSAGTVEFVGLPMSREANVFRAAIPAAATSGRYVHYYIEAYDPRGRLAASNGSARGPNVVIIK
ncbi:MAG: hypothetical protein IT371_06375 [Deltaproteobacteria bacterium]|nr:hypothetical protein [Deltaproteobacteria bacterium]